MGVNPTTNAMRVFSVGRSSGIVGFVVCSVGFLTVFVD
jgi:hypothetical protein